MERQQVEIDRLKPLPPVGTASPERQQVGHGGACREQPGERGGLVPETRELGSHRRRRSMQCRHNGVAPGTFRDLLREAARQP